MPIYDGRFPALKNGIEHLSIFCSDKMVAGVGNVTPSEKESLLIDSDASTCTIINAGFVANYTLRMLWMAA